MKIKNKKTNTIHNVEEKSVDSSESFMTKSALTKEIGGPKRLEPTRFGDWEQNGRCIDF